MLDRLAEKLTEYFAAAETRAKLLDPAVAYACEVVYKKLQWAALAFWVVVLLVVVQTCALAWVAHRLGKML